MLGVLQVVILHHLNRNLLKPPLQMVRQLASMPLIAVFIVPEPLLGVMGHEGDLAVHEIEDRGAALLAVDTDADLVGFGIFARDLNGEDYWRDVIIL